MSFILPKKKEKKERTPEQKVRRGAWAAGAVLLGFFIILALPNGKSKKTREETPAEKAVLLMDGALDSLLQGSILAGGTVTEKDDVTELSIIEDTPLRDSLTVVRAELDAVKLLGDKADRNTLNKLMEKKNALEVQLGIWENDPDSRSEYFSRRVLVASPKAFPPDKGRVRLFVCRQRMEKKTGRQALLYIVELLHSPQETEEKLIDKPENR